MMDRETQALKVQLLETQKALLQQSIEISALKLEKLEPMISRERMVLMALERTDASAEPVPAIPGQTVASAATAANGT